MADSTATNIHLGTTEVVWNLSHLYNGPEDENINTDINWCEDQAKVIKESYHAGVAKLDAPSLLTLVTQLENLDCTLTKLATYSFLFFTTRMDDAAAGALDQKIHELASRCGGETVFFELEWNQLSDDEADTLLNNQLLTPYRHYLTCLRRYKPHHLSEAEEKLLLEKEAVGRNSWTTLFDKVLSKKTFGPRKRMEEEVLSDLYAAERKVRKRAADEFTEGLKDMQHILTHIFNTLAADKMITDRLRRHSGWIDAMNLQNELHATTVDTLVAAVVSRYDLVHRYYRLKKRLLRLKRLEHYDRYAPLPSLPTQLIDWNSCRDIVLASFANFSPEMAEIGARFFAEKWIHAPLGEGKRGGAFAHPCVPGVHPYILVNYTGTLQDVSTVAHELGHGIHQALAAKQGHFNSDTPIPLAETASVFSELLVFNRQLALLKDKDERRAFICQKLESIFATVFRQTAMNRFEHLMHEGRRQHGELSCRQLSSYWLETQGEMFGNSIDLSEDYGLWWSYIPHFLSTPGYVYSYAFGELLVLSLYGLYRRQGSGFVDKYLKLLAAGGSSSPYNLLQPFGIDLNSREFWQEGLSIIEEMLLQIE